MKQKKGTGESAEIEMTQTIGNLDLLETFQHGVFVFDADLNLTAYNKAGVDLMGLPPEMMVLGTSIKEHFRFNASRGEYGEGDLEPLVERRMEPLRDGKPFDYQFPRPDGRVIWRHGKFNKDGWLVVTFTDVTARVREEDYLRSENSSLSQINRSQKVEIKDVNSKLKTQYRVLETIVENISDGVSLVGRDLRLKMANDRLFELLDLPIEMNREGLPICEIYTNKAELGGLSPEDTEKGVGKFIEQEFGSEATVIERELNSGRILKVSRKVVDEGMVTTISDVTDLKSDQRLLEAENKAFGQQIQAQGAALDAQGKLADLLHTAIDATETSIILFDENDRFVFANKRYREMNPEGGKIAVEGMLYEDFLLTNIKKSYYSELTEPYDDYIANRKAYLAEHGTNMLVVQTKFGSWLQIHEHRLPDGSLLSMATDITELKEAQLYLEQNEERFRDFAEDGADWFWEMDETLTFSYVNGKVDEVLGISAAEMIGKSRHEVHAYSEVTAQGNWNAYLDSLPDVVPFTSPPVTMVKPDGEIRYILTTGKPIFNANGGFKGYRGVGRDITELTRTEEALRRSQKMEAVGQLSGGIAHDFNNILGIIFGNLELLAEQLEEGSSNKQFVNNALKGASRAAELTRKLLGFSRHHHGSIDHVNINELVNNMNTLISKSLTATISVEMNLQDDVWNVAINVGDFEDALLNLAINARDAMPGGGDLTVETRNQTVQAGDVQDYSDVVAGNYVVISVSDTGTGMDKDIRERVFEPFYTTKDVGKGTGLGLSMVFAFVKRSGGFINLNSESGHGSTFNIYLPVSKAENVPSSPDEVEINGPMGRGERILVVDDEKDLVAITTHALQAFGYNVFMATNSSKALELLHKNSDIELLFSDVILAEAMDGFELAQQAKTIHPNLKCLLTSGFTKKRGLQHDAAQFEDDNAGTLLRKPYTRKELAIAIRSALDQK